MSGGAGHTAVRGEKIVTHYDPKPIPDRSFDWSAVSENYDGAPDAPDMPIGYGETEAAAIADLIEQLEDDAS